MINHIGFIMDGNRRYAEKQDISKKEGYKKGMEKFLEFISFQIKYNIPQTSYFALSTDNYTKRSDDELKTIYLLIKALSKNKEIKDFLIQNKVKINIKGDISEIKKKEKKISQEDKKFIENLEKMQDEINSEAKKSKYIVNIALNYDGQKEILHSFKEILKKINLGELKEKSITEKTIKKHIWFNENEPPEIIVRPGNAPRLSGFMLWDSKYSEIYFTKKLWPELDESDFVKIINWFEEQKRNFGK